MGLGQPFPTDFKILIFTKIPGALFVIVEAEGGHLRDFFLSSKYVYQFFQKYATSVKTLGLSLLLGVRCS